LFLFINSLAANLIKIIGTRNSCHNPKSVFAQHQKKKHKSKREKAQIQKASSTNPKGKQHKSKRLVPIITK
jgi:hypothetical protein